MGNKRAPMGKDQAEAVFEDHRDVKQGTGWHPLVVLITWSGIFLFIIFVGMEEPYLWMMEKDFGWFFYVGLVALFWMVSKSALYYYFYQTTVKLLYFQEGKAVLKTFSDHLNKTEIGKEIEEGEVEAIRPFYPGWQIKLTIGVSFFDYDKPSYKLTLADGTVRYVMSGMPGAEEAVARLREFRG
jgi:hypothetical protein